MGFFKKIFKGVKKVFKKIGSGIKRAFKSIGKFMGKIGVVGQIALSLLLPGIGTMIGGLAGGMMASGSALVRGAGTFLNAAVNVGSKMGGLVKTVTQGVTKVIGNVAGAVLNKIPGATDLVQNLTGKLGINEGAGLNMANASFENAVKAAQSTVTDFAAQGRDLFSMDTLTNPNKYISSATKAQIEAAKSGVPSTEDILETSGQMPAPSADMEAYMEAGPQTTTITDAPAISSKYDIELANRPDSAIPDAFEGYQQSLLEAPVDPLKPSVSPKIDLNVQAPDLDALSEQVKPTVGERIRGAFDAKVEDVKSTLQDPLALAKTGFETFAQTRREDEMLAAQQAALAGGDVINVGQYQDPSAFLAYQTQNTVAPIASFQQPANYNAPLSSWGQQFMYDPFAQLPMRTA